MRRIPTRAVVVLAVTLASCTVAPDPTTSTASPTSTTTTTTTVTTTTTTTTLPPTTTTQSLADRRRPLLQEVEAEGWTRYEDEVGWSIWLPPDAEVDETSAGVAIILPGVGLIGIGVAADAAQEDTGSFDYLFGNLDVAVDLGLIRELPVLPDFFYLDINQNDQEDDLDIVIVETQLAVDANGDPLPEDQISPVWWYGYYDPAARPALGYIFQTFGTNPLLFMLADRIILTFEPAAGYPD